MSSGRPTKVAISNESPPKGDRLEFGPAFRAFSWSLIGNRQATLAIPPTLRPPPPNLAGAIGREWKEHRGFTEGKPTSWMVDERGSLNSQFFADLSPPRPLSPPGLPPPSEPRAWQVELPGHRQGRGPEQGAHHLPPRRDAKKPTRAPLDFGFPAHTRSRFLVRKNGGPIAQSGFM